MWLIFMISEAESIANLGVNGRAYLLLNYYGKGKASPRPAARVKSAAQTTAYRGRGSMKNHFNQMGKYQTQYIPGEQSKSFERTRTV